MLLNMIKIESLIHPSFWFVSLTDALITDEFGESLQ